MEKALKGKRATTKSLSQEREKVGEREKRIRANIYIKKKDHSRAGRLFYMCCRVEYKRHWTQGFLPHSSV